MSFTTKQLSFVKKTAEQDAIEEASVSGDPLKIVAYAGTGKTKTIEFISERRDVFGLYVAFNKAAQRDAERRMPANIMCRTFNSLGWEAMKVSEVWGFTGVGDTWRVPPKQALKALRLDDETGISAVRATLRRFVQSLDETVGWKHVPREALARFDDPGERREFSNEVVRAARTLWYWMIDPKVKEYPLPHDGYMKLWYHQGGQLPFEPKMVLLDEGQDMSPINWALAEGWPGQKIVVGDSLQQIYAFRGAIDALDRVDYPTYYLTRSFRFGQVIAEMANALLKLDGESRPPLEGNPDIESTVSFDGERPKGRHTVLCRTNMGLMDEALELAKQGRSIAVVGQIDEALKLLTSAWALYSDDPKNVKHPDIRMLGDWDGLEEAAKDSPELALTVRRVDQYRAKIPRIARELRQAVANDPDDADVILSTVHKAKGMEWPMVRLADDFPDLMRFDEEEGRWKVRKDERNLLYVAATRAVKTLHGNTALLTGVGLSRA